MLGEQRRLLQRGGQLLRALGQAVDRGGLPLRNPEVMATARDIMTALSTWTSGQQRTWASCR